MKRQVRGISIHTCSRGLLYYVHDEQGKTREVSEEDDLHLRKTKMELRSTHF
ncbi:hypothetical protein [Melghirimyces algeriensis]|uniref:hypothetical protein n=1 Tax=Melghirimyces algeriensis TaxID=910412 RepID=UPI00163D8FFE|nr:hypothetical protein [Melghirimyces algeriensis]